MKTANEKKNKKGELLCRLYKKFRKQKKVMRKEVYVCIIIIHIYTLFLSVFFLLASSTEVDFNVVDGKTLKYLTFEHTSSILHPFSITTS